LVLWAVAVEMNGSLVGSTLTPPAHAGFCHCAGTPLELVRPEILAHKAFEPVLIIGRQHLKNLDIRLRVKGGGQVSQIYGA
jgi:ribosomal protein S9